MTHGSIALGRLAEQRSSGDRLSGIDKLFRSGSVAVLDALGEIPFHL